MLIRSLRSGYKKGLRGASSGLQSNFFYETSWVVFFILFLAFIKLSVLSFYLIPSESMLPNILAGDRIMTNKLAYGLWLPFANKPFLHWSTPKRGDVILFHVPDEQGTFIKRVIGLSGDTVTFKKGILFINGEIYKEQGILTEPEPDQTFFESRRFIVPPHSVFVLGDNRDHSVDSRVFGYVPENFIYGKANFIFFSTEGSKSLLPQFRTERFFKSL